MSLRKSHWAMMAVVVAVVGVGACSLWAALKVQADKENVVASRLEGTWTLHADLTKRLTGEKSDSAGYQFTKDDDVAAAVPDKFEKILKDMTIYMSGKMKVTRGKNEETYPFVLVSYKGNPRVIYFREGDGQPMGNAESLNVMLAQAKDKANDLLFVGGDFNNQPFRAFERVKDK